MNELISNSINLGPFGKEGLHVLAGLVAGAQCFSLTANGLKETVALIDKLTGS